MMEPMYFIAAAPSAVVAVVFWRRGYPILSASLVLLVGVSVYLGAIGYPGYLEAGRPPPLPWEVWP